ncbi:MAG TPA: TetR family transcriptional regulator [Pseudomonadales bacterium]|nr:TetR family transcriptional regulator [Pseudomonadales bacterium]
MVRKTKEEAEQTRNQILDAAERVFYIKGVSRTTLTDIADEAGVTRGAIYWHFENKSELFNAMHEREKLPFETLFSQIRAESPQPLEGLRDICINALTDLQTNEKRRRVLCVLKLRCEYVDEMAGAVERMLGFQHSMVQHITAILDRAEELGQLREGVNTKMAAIGLHAYMGGLFESWLRDGDSFCLNSCAENLVDIYFYSLRKR